MGYDYDYDRSEREKFDMEYYLNHKYCPVCGSKEHTSTLMGFILNMNKKEDYKDLNQCECTACGNKHLAHDRVSWFTLMGKKYTDNLTKSLSLVEGEVLRAKSKYPENFNSFHEGYAVILEEMDELWDEIKKKNMDKVKVKEEAIQTAAMLLRLITELL